tara:strand:- start:2598 stop:2897 length:300 start_codon:yes stop_codon:yes gene_type:complete
VQILIDNNINFEIIEYLKNAPTINQLKTILKKLNLKPKDLLRRGEKIYKDLNIQSFLDNEEKILITLVNNPKILERPIILSESNGIIGRPPENIFTLIK